MKRKVCIGCGEAKPQREFPTFRSGDQIRQRPRCRPCIRSDEREQYRQRKQYGPWAERRLAQVRAAYRRRVGDPEGYRKQMAIWRRDNARRKADREQTAVERERPMHLPVGPFRAWLCERLDEYGNAHMLAEMLEMEPRRLYALLNENKTVTLDVADRALCAMGNHIDELYPYEDAA